MNHKIEPLNTSTPKTAIPVLSIVTINLNNACGLKRTIDSVRAQKNSGIQYIVIDGKSTDNSIGIIHKNLDIVTIHRSEPDGGIYNAMNKGLSEASGEYIMFLNSGDYLVTSESLTELALKYNDYDVIYGNIGLVRKRASIICEAPELVEFWKKYQHHLPFQPATLIRRQLCIECGGFNEKYSISADIGLMYQILSKRSTRTKKVKSVITVFDETGISSRKPMLALYQRFVLTATTYPQYLHQISCLYLRMTLSKAFKVLLLTCKEAMNQRGQHS